MRIHVAIPTVGRARTVARLVDHLADQTRAPNGVVVVATTAADVAGIHSERLLPNVLLSERGLCRQRNCALDFLAPLADVVVFFDDDFVPANDYLENVERIMREDASVVGITGDLIADGIRRAEISFEEALALLDARETGSTLHLQPRQALYGCNMAISLAKAEGLRFDTALPLYGWQEDIDFTFQLGQRGRLVSGQAVTGVHLGVRSARSSGRRLGYSQVANLVHLWRKGTMQPGLGRRLLVRNLTANVARSLWPEPHIDRRGRLAGNLLALTDWLRGRIDPRRIEHL